MPTYSIVIPVHNEEAVLHHLFLELDVLAQKLDGASEFVFIDDGSTDDSWLILSERADRDRRCKLIRLSRNFGHQLAVTAGLDRATGDAVVIMDADLQDPPEVVIEMARRWREGYEVAYGQRTDREQDTRFKRVTARCFYKLLNRLSSVDIPEQVGDFRLIDRAVVDAINQMPERNRYVRGMFAWLGFRQIAVEYARPARRAGTTSYSPKKMLRLANDGVIGYSKAPLRAPIFLGAAMIAAGSLGIAGGGLLMASTRRSSRLVQRSGAALLGGVQLMAVGLLGEYVARIFDESLGRPLYVVSETRGDESEEIDETVNGQVHPIFGHRASSGALERKLVSPSS